jgi:hypothetical protein
MTLNQVIAELEKISEKGCGYREIYTGEQFIREVQADCNEGQEEQEGGRRIMNNECVVYCEDIDDTECLQYLDCEDCPAREGGIFH